MRSDGTESVRDVLDVFRVRTDAPERCRTSLPGPEPQPGSSRGVTESPEDHFRVRDGAGADRSEAGKTRRAEAGTSAWAKAAERRRKEPKAREGRPGGGRASPERAEVRPEVAERARAGRGRRPAAAPHKMADGEEVTLDGRPLQALRVADLKAALQQRGLAKSGQKSALIKRLRGALMLENLQKHSTLHATFQPNSQQYLEKQHELLQQRLQREAREAAELEASGKSYPISRERNDSDEEGTRRQERRSTRVRQARAAKPPEGTQAVGPEEREAPPRGRRTGPRPTLKLEEEDDEEEEEEEDDDEEEEEEDDEEEEAKAPEGKEASRGMGEAWAPGPQASSSPQEIRGQEEKEEVPMELEPHQAGASPPAGPPAQPPGPDERPDGGPEDEERKEAAAQHKAFKRKISVVSAKGAAAGNSDTEGGQSGGRKRRWGSSTAATQKKPSISITTDSLKSLIPEMKPVAGQEAVVDLHADDSRISEDEGERHGEPPAHEKGLKICRTVTQVVPAEGQENGQGEEEEEEEKEPEEEQAEAPQVTAELPLPAPVEHEVKKVTLSDTLTRRSISQQRSGVSITIDDPVRTAQLPSPPRAKPSPIVHICNLVRPFTLGQLKELLGRTGTLVEEAFWIDKIKSHCYVTYSTVEEAVLTRNALHGVKWPQSNPKFLSADFAEQDELDFHRGLLPERAVEAAAAPGAGPAGGRGGRRSAPRERSREPERAVREQWAEREREMERRERTRAEREWDRDKVREGPRSRERRRKEPPKAKEKKGEKKEKAPEEPPAKLLDDLFRKTKAAPCIYWLPLTDTQVSAGGRPAPCPCSVQNLVPWGREVFRWGALGRGWPGTLGRDRGLPAQHSPRLSQSVQERAAWGMRGSRAGGSPALTPSLAVRTEAGGAGGLGDERDQSRGLPGTHVSRSLYRSRRSGRPGG
ncbi:dual specificity tyrosine-phosphorylation-regulated kinase 3 [Platysternon megacephalum]|uniref:Dual specificity tyrosine-phosphorylation-regulated kinase 3 n=1 Tax=Platysternon megacephalum TaxID=55544 RepID=A0A4D9DK93_9SAUR|nr:dual specificity tyrosine-phosphorylation-regulated kinase 3 [Platysternon megacephalum]